MTKRNIPTDVWKKIQKGSPSECWEWVRKAIPKAFGGINGVGLHPISYNPLISRSNN